jgi:type 1 fimbria pilin
MNMIKFLIASTILLAPLSNADPLVKINLRFKALIVDRTCTVAPESKSIDVALGTWGTKNIINIGDQTRPIPFSIRLLDCTAKNVSVSFDGPKYATNPQFLALSNESTAKNVAIQILNKDRLQLPMETLTSPVNINNSKNLELIFFANYIAIGKNVSAGSANSTANFILNYD